MTKSKRTEIEKLAAAPIHFTLGGEGHQCPPLPLGEALVWAEDAMTLLEKASTAGSTTEGETATQLAMGRSAMRLVPEALDLICRFAKWDADHRAALDAVLGANITRTLNECFETVNIMLGVAQPEKENPPKGIRANGKAEPAQVP